MLIDTTQRHATMAKPLSAHAEDLSSGSPRSYASCSVPRLRVLIVEYRDDHFDDLKMYFESLGCQVARAARSDVVSAAARVFSPDLILLCDQMPEESSRLIACKLRFGRLKQPIWLYTASGQDDCTAWRDWSGINQVLVYAGRLASLREVLSRELSVGATLRSA